MGWVFFTQEQGVLQFSYHLIKRYKNNEAECEALIVGLEIALSLGIDNMNIYNDS